MSREIYKEKVEKQWRKEITEIWKVGSVTNPSRVHAPFIGSWHLMRMPVVNYLGADFKPRTIRSVGCQDRTGGAA
jgi:hypothetical protein